MANPYKKFLSLIPSEPLDKAEVIALTTDGALVELMSGARVKVRGSAQVGDHVFIRGGRIEGPAPALTGVDQII